jgi:DNA-binding PadR family transcriptional regulator
MTSRPLTTLEYALLGLVAQSPQSGYDLRKTFDTTAMGSFSGSPGAVYPALRRLERRGLVEGEIDATTALRPRMVFRPTAAGRETLEAWLVREIDRTDVERNVDELMLRFALHSVLGSTAPTQRFLEEFLGEVESYVDELRRQQRQIPDGTPLQSRMALLAGVEQYRAFARWARKAIKAFEEGTP